MATPSERRGNVARFGAFEMDFHAGELRKSGMRLNLSGQAFQVLVFLVEGAGEIIYRDELRKRLWTEETFVDFDHGLNNAILKLRDVLGDSAKSPRFIETVPRRGYRFLAPVDLVAQGATPGSARTVRSEDALAGTLADIRQKLLITNSASELRGLQYRVHSVIEENAGDPRLYEARGLLDEVGKALEHALADADLSGITRKGTIAISTVTAACVFDDPGALSRHDVFGRWLTLGRVGDQIILVDHTVREINGREVIRIISGRKATPAERRAYEEKQETGGPR